MKRYVRLGPFGGLQPGYIRQADGPTPMAGGFNVEVVNGEWWVRQGLGPISGRLGTIPWYWGVELRTGGTTRTDRYVTKTLVLASTGYIIVLTFADRPRSDSLPIAGFDEEFGQDVGGNLYDITVPYLTSDSADVAMTAGSRIAELSSVSGTIAARNIFVVDPTGMNDQLYRVTAISGTTITLDRPFEAATSQTFTAVDFYSAIGTSFSSRDAMAGGLVLFEQAVHHAADALGYTHAEVGDTTQTIQYAIRAGLGASFITHVAAPVTGSGLDSVSNFVRGTHDSTSPDSWELDLARLRPAVYKDRLFVAAAAPIGSNSNQSSGETTVWYSRPNDFMTWHTGLADLGGTPNFLTFPDQTNPITGLAVLGESIIAHRLRTQEIGQPYGNGFRFTTNNQGFGFYPKDCYVSVGSMHIGWTRYGPAVFTEAGIELIDESLIPQLQAYQAAGTEPQVLLAGHDENRRRVYFVLGVGWIDSAANKTFERIVRHQDASYTQVRTSTEDSEVYAPYSPVFVYDYVTGQYWFEEHVNIYGAMTANGQLFFSRFDGVLSMCPSGFSGKDYDLAKTNAQHVVPARVETPWLEHAEGMRCKLSKVSIILRALDSDDDVDDYWGSKFSPLRVSDLWDATTDTIHFGTLEIMADEKEDVVRESIDLNMTVSDMMGKSLEGNRQLPLLRFEKAIRAAGRRFKYRLKNDLSAAASAAGHKQGHFRLVDIALELDVEDSTRAAGAIGG